MDRLKIARPIAVDVMQIIMRRACERCDIDRFAVKRADHRQRRRTAQPTRERFIIGLLRAMRNMNTDFRSA